MKTKQEQIEQQLRVYGCTTESLENEYQENARGDASFYAVCILSDVQELMEIAKGGTKEERELTLERARKYVNKAKWFTRYDARKAEVNAFNKDLSSKGANHV